MAQTSRAQQKAKEAAAAVDAVSSAAQQLGAVDTTTNQTLGSLAAAAAALNTITAPKDSVGGAKGQGASGKQQLPAVWDLKGRIEQHKQKVRWGLVGYGLRCLVQHILPLKLPRCFAASELALFAACFGMRVVCLLAAALLVGCSTGPRCSLWAS